MGNCLTPDHDAPVAERTALKKQQKFDKIKTSKGNQESKIVMAQKTGQINLQGANLKSVPKEIYEILKMTLINLDQNGISMLDEKIGNLRKLKVLSIQSNLLSSLPQSFGLLECLSDLNLDNNKLVDIPGLPNSLTKFSAAKNQITTFPAALQGCAKLVTINLSNNKIQGAIPGWVGEFKQVQVIYLDFNSIKEIEEGVVKCTNLQTIHLENNKIATIPTVILRDSSISWFNLKGNQINKRQLMELDGFDEFEKRRQDQVNKGISAGISVNTSLCGLD